MGNHISERTASHCLGDNGSLCCNHPFSCILYQTRLSELLCCWSLIIWAVVLGDHNSICIISCLWLTYSRYKTSSVLAMQKSLSYVIISAQARTVSTNDLNDLCAVWSVQQQELPGEMPETDRFSSQGINEHTLHIQIAYLNWYVHSTSYMGISPKLSCNCWSASSLGS